MTHLRRGTPTESCLTGFGSHRIIGKDARHRRKVPDVTVTTRKRAMIAAWFVVIE